MSIPTYNEEMLKKAEAGDAWEQTNMGLCYQFGLGIEKDLDKAVYWYELAANNNDVTAMGKLALFFLRTETYKSRWKEGVKWIQLAAEGGHPTMQFLFSEMLEGSPYVKTDLNHSRFWLEESANNMFPQALYKLGDLLLDEQKVPEALELFNKASDLNEIRSQLMLSKLYSQNDVVKADPEKAMHYLQLAKQHTDTLSSFFIGSYYGSLRDYSSALKYYMLAENDYPEASYSIGMVYRYIEGFIDKKLAAKAFEKAAKKGNVYAEYEFGKCYYDNFGVFLDYNKAKHWLRKAAKKGHPEAKKLLDTLKDW